MRIVRSRPEVFKEKCGWLYGFYQFWKRIRKMRASPPYPHEQGVPPPPTGRPRGGSGRDQPHSPPPCPERGPEAGRTHTRAQYFKPPNRTILRYVDHPEHKYEGNLGLLTVRGSTLTG